MFVFNDIVFLLYEVERISRWNFFNDAFFCQLWALLRLLYVYVCGAVALFYAV